MYMYTVPHYRPTAHCTCGYLHHVHRHTCSTLNTCTCPHHVHDLERGRGGGRDISRREGGKERDETLDSTAHLAAHLLQAASSCEIGLVFQYISVACLVKIKLSMLADIIMHVYSRNKGQGLNTLDPPPCELCMRSKVTRARALEVR